MIISWMETTGLNQLECAEILSSLFPIKLICVNPKKKVYYHKQEMEYQLVIIITNTPYSINIRTIMRERAKSYNVDIETYEGVQENTSRLLKAGF
jgi:predicted transcriptional regulator